MIAHGVPPVLAIAGALLGVVALGLALVPLLGGAAASRAAAGGLALLAAVAALLRLADAPLLALLAPPALALGFLARLEDAPALPAGPVPWRYALAGLGLAGLVLLAGLPTQEAVQNPRAVAAALGVSVGLCGVLAALVRRAPGPRAAGALGGLAGGALVLAAGPAAGAAVSLGASASLFAAVGAAAALRRQAG